MMTCTDKQYLDAFDTEQKRLAQMLIPYTVSPLNIQTVAGVDILYKNDRAICCIVVCDYRTKQPIEIITNETCGEGIPYIPGKFGFKEVPPFLVTLQQLKTRVDLFMFDGNGTLHENMLGLASHAGVYLDVPSIGVAKTRYKFDDFAYEMYGRIYHKETNMEIGRALHTRPNCNPVYVSIGNRIGMNDAARVVTSLVDPKISRQPIPLRLADIETHKYR